jgi:sugar phosphate isomerase/epimerase
MSTKRGVSLYSYQQTQFFKKMDWKDMVKEVHDNLETDGIEIIDEQTIRNYPFSSEQFIFDWNSYLARYDMKAVTMDVYMDVHQFRDHVITIREAAERLKNDIKLAAKLGFQNVRCLSAVPIEVIEFALDTAERYNVRIGKEIHAPIPIKPSGDVYGAMGMMARPRVNMVEQIIELVNRTGSKHVGLVPDMGIFQHSPSKVTIDYTKRHVQKPEAVDFILGNSKKYSQKDMKDVVDEKFPEHGLSNMMINRMCLHQAAAKPEDIIGIIPYIISIHGKFYNMTEIPGKPGQYEDQCIDYETPLRHLRENGFDGYINSEFEGQRDQQDMGIEKLVDEVDQVRRHHEMLKRLI